MTHLKFVRFLFRNRFVNFSRYAIMVYFKWTIFYGVPLISISRIDMDMHIILPITIVFTIKNISFIIRPFRFGNHNLISKFEAQDKLVLWYHLLDKGNWSRGGWIDPQLKIQNLKIFPMVLQKRFWIKNSFIRTRYRKDRIYV